MDKVLCLVKTTWFEPDIDSQEAWMDLVPNATFPRKIEEVIPLIDHLHNDKENGQEDAHYHVDSRYTNLNPLTRKYPKYFGKNEKLEYRDLPRLSIEYKGNTPIEFISKSTFKHKCIHKGKCPHRGFDLTNIEVVDGVITCPLHGLKFDAITKQLKL